ncbi:MAG: hypothetical protein KF774_09625 [Planctomyces sp.]|nr:hypothetical protein [Planctomyces sp.]
MRALRWGVLGAVWIGLVVWAWRETVPLPPTWTREFPEGKARLAWTTSGELALGASGSKLRSVRGPIEFLSGRDGQKVRELFSADDEVLTPHGEIDNVLIVNRGGRWQAVDARTGDERDELPVEQSTAWAVPADRGRKVLYIDGRTMRMRDIEARRELWASDGYEWGCVAATADLIVAVPQIRPDAPAVRQPNAHVIVDARNGQLDPRFADVQGIMIAFPSPDQRWLAIKTFTELLVYNAATAELRLSIPAHPSEFHRFSPDSLHVVIDYPMQGGGLSTARWDIAEGTELIPPPAVGRAAGDGARLVSPDGRYALEIISLDASQPRWINAWLRTMPILARFQLPDTKNVIHLTAAHTGRRLGSIDGHRHAQWQADGSAFRMDDNHKFVSMYPVPPVRNWGWLIHRCVWPLAGFWLAVQLVSRSWSWLRTGRRQRSGGDPSEAVATGG